MADDSMKQHPDYPIRYADDFYIWVRKQKDSSCSHITYSRRGIEEVKEDISHFPTVGIPGTKKTHAVIGAETGSIKIQQLLLSGVFSLKLNLPRRPWGLDQDRHQQSFNRRA